MSPRKQDHGDSNLLWVVGVLLVMACSCAVYTGYIIDKTLTSLRTSNTMALLITSDGFRSDDAKLEAQLNQAQRALQDSADIALALTVACLIVAFGLILRIAMSRGLIAMCLALMLSGCSSWWSKDDPKPVQPAMPSAAISKLGSELDEGDSKVAAAVTVMVEQKDKPPVVEAEGKVALAHLPPPADKHLATARARAATGDAKVYADEVKVAKAFLAKVEADWAKAEQQAKKNEQDLTAALGEISRLKDEIKRVENEGSRNVWTVTGAGLVVLGGLAMVFAGPKIGFPLLLTGAFAGAVPHIIDSPYFAWIAGVTTAVCAALGLWWVYDLVRDRVKASEGNQGA